MISVIIPVYNVEKYLEKCLHSVLTNTFRDLEVICVNDGSPDNCLQILKRIQAEDDRVIIINQENQGVQKARNNGIKAANGEYIAFIDSDDWVHPQYFQTLINCIEKTEADVAICGCQKFDEDEIVDINCYERIHYRKLSSKQLEKSYYARHMCWGRLYRRHNIDDIWFVPEVKTGDDTLFNLCVLSGLKKPRVYETDAKLYYYLQRANSIIHASSYDKVSGFIEWFVDNRRNNDSLFGGPWSWILLMQAIKLALSFRYGASLYNNKKDVKKAGTMLWSMIPDMIKNRHISAKDKIIHTVMALSPRLYRLYRIYDDPTLKIWEKNVKGMYS